MRAGCEDAGCGEQLVGFNFGGKIYGNFLWWLAFCVYSIKADKFHLVLFQPNVARVMGEQLE